MQAILGAVPLPEKAQRHKNTAQHSETTGKPQALFHPHIARLIEQAVYFSSLLENDSQFNGRGSLITQLHTPPHRALNPNEQKLARYLFAAERQLNERAGFVSLKQMCIWFEARLDMFQSAKSRGRTGKAQPPSPLTHPKKGRVLDRREGYQPT